MQQERTLQIDGCGGYKTSTSVEFLVESFTRLLPDVWHLLDVPAEYQAIGRKLSHILDGEWDPELEALPETEQLAFAIPLLNAIRLTYEATPPEGRNEYFRAAFCARVRNAFRVLQDATAAVSFVAIRNCLAGESRNLASRSGEAFQGMNMICDMRLTAIPEFMAVYLKIHAELSRRN